MEPEEAFCEHLRRNVVVVRQLVDQGYVNHMQGQLEKIQHRNARVDSAQFSETLQLSLLSSDRFSVLQKIAGFSKKEA